MTLYPAGFIFFFISFNGFLFILFFFYPEQDVMLKIKNWVADEKKHVRYCRDWTEKEVRL